MRLVQVTIPTGKREAVLGALDDEGIDYVVSDETSGREYAAIAYVPLPQNAVEPILEDLRESGLGEKGYTVVLEASTVVSRRYEELEERFAEEEDENRIAREELVTAAASLAPSLSTYVIMTLISAMIATAGLLLDSPAVVVGSMVIAPLVGPAMATSVGTVVDDSELFRRGAKLQVLGILLAVLGAATFAAFVRGVHLVPGITDVTAVGQIRERVAPDFLSLAVALGAGVAGVVSLSSGVSTALVGVMIAVALIPPAATVGIGLAWGQPLVALGAAVLTLVNVLSINLAALVTLWYVGYRPLHWFEADEAKSATIKRVGALALAILVLSAFLGGVTLDTLQRSNTAEEIETASQDLLAERGLVHLDTELTYTNRPVFRTVSGVVVTVGLEPGTDPPALAGPLDERFDAIVGEDVTTQVRYVTIEGEGLSVAA